MPATHAVSFFSCSFDTEDKALNEFFLCICEGLGIVARNVSAGYCVTPPEMARRLIDDSKMVLAVVTRRHEIGEMWAMPNAVSQELAMAYAMKKPTLMFIENGVKVDGFTTNFGTYLNFDRSRIFETEFLKKVISSVHELRLIATEGESAIPHMDVTGYFAEKVSHLIEAIKDGERPAWRYANSRRLVFTRPFPGSIVNSAWAESVPPGSTEKIKHSIECKPSRADLRPTPAVIKDTPQQLTIEINFGGEPQENDTLDVDFSYSSPNLNHWPDPTSSDHKQTKIDGQYFDCFDGMVPIQPTRDLHVQFRFPGWYPLDKSSVFPFVGSYSNNVDYVVDSEVKRCEIKQSEFGSEIQIDIKVESPLLRHVYGVAWRLLSEEASELNHVTS